MWWSAYQIDGKGDRKSGLIEDLFYHAVLPGTDFRWEMCKYLLLCFISLMMMSNADVWGCIDRRQVVFTQWESILPLSWKKKKGKKSKIAVLLVQIL